MSRWFRFYDDAIHDAKVLKLSDAMHRAWVTLLCIASKNNGALPSAADIALTLRVKPSVVASWITELNTCGLLDRDGDGFAPHNWSDRQYKSDSSAERMKRHRDRKRDVTGDGASDVTVTVQNRTETEKNRTDAAPDGAHLVLVPPDLETQFFRRAQEVLGSRGFGAKLLQVKQKNVSLAMSALELAATKDDPKEYVGRIISGRGTDIEDLRARGEAW